MKNSAKIQVKNGEISAHNTATFLSERGNIDLSGVSTKELVEELRKREGVAAVDVPPEEDYLLITEEKALTDDGPAIILIVTD